MKIPFLPQLPQFSPLIAVMMARAAQAAYLEEAAVRLLSVEHGAANFEFVSAQGTECFVARRGDDVLIAFRGTSALADWLTDARFRQEDWQGLRVHRGFKAAYTAVRDRLLSAALPGRRFYFTGHSLGGALAMIAAADFAAHGFDVGGVYTFGQPRVLARRSVRTYNEMLGDRTFRFTNQLDVVTRLPGVLLGYRHAGQEIYFDACAGTVVNPAWWRKIPGHIWSLGQDLDETLPPATFRGLVRDHFCKQYLERICP